MVLEPLPFENREEGRYLNDRDRMLSLLSPGSTTFHYWVDVEFFMDMQKERDEYRRTLALVNAAVRKGRMQQALSALGRAGFGAGEACAIDEIIAWAKAPT